MNNEPMIERVARAIAQSLGSADWHVHIAAARAAVLALREPTIEMLDAATSGTVDYGHLPDDWRTMIDHVAGERVT